MHSLVQYLKQQKWLPTVVVSILFVVSHILFFLFPNNEAINIDYLLLLQLLIIISYMLLPVFLFSKLLDALHSAIVKAPNESSAFFLNAVSFVYCILGVGALFGFYNLYNTDSITSNYICAPLYSFFEKTVYIQMLPKQYDYTSVIGCWVIIPGVILIVCAIFLFIAASRAKKARKDILAFLRRKEELEIRVKTLGFNYETCDYYLQTGLSFDSLNHEDGSFGEFEIYRQLVNSSIGGLTFFFNREIPRSDGLFSEIDIIILHRKGIFVIENKDYSTIIYGNAAAHDWTIIDHSGRKRSIYSPIFQNKTHVQVLKQFLLSQGVYSEMYNPPIHSIVSFTDTQSNKSDDVLSRINTTKTDTHVCTSQNIAFIIENLLKNSPSTLDCNSISAALCNLSVSRKK